MKKQIIRIVLVVAVGMLATACYNCHIRSKKKVKIDRENYNSVETVGRYFTVLWEDRGFIDDYRGTVKVYGCMNSWKGEKFYGLQYKCGSPSIDVRFELSDEEIRSLVEISSLIDTTTSERYCYIEGEISYIHFRNDWGCEYACPVIIVNNPEDIRFE